MYKHIQQFQRILQIYYKKKRSKQIISKLLTIIDSAIIYC